MALKRTSAIPELRLTQHALQSIQRHLPIDQRLCTHACSLPARKWTIPSPRRMLRAWYKWRRWTRYSWIQNNGEIYCLLLAKILSSLMSQIQSRLRCANPSISSTLDLLMRSHAFCPPRAPQVLSEQNIYGIGTRSLLLTPGSRITSPTIEAAVEESPRQSIDSDHDSARLIKTTSAKEDQLRDILPSHFPLFRHIQNYGELGFYIDRSQYAISVGSGPVDDLHYGIIIVPFGEEHMLFRSKHVSREVPLATQHESSLRSVDEVQLGIINSEVAARESFTGPATLSKVRAPRKRTRNSREKSSRITKATRTRRPQTPAPTRRSQRLKDGRRTT